jgi:hypothetical protein
MKLPLRGLPDETAIMLAEAILTYRKSSTLCNGVLRE